MKDMYSLQGTVCKISGNGKKTYANSANVDACCLDATHLMSRLTAVMSG